MAEPQRQPARLVRTWIVAILALLGGGVMLCGGLAGLATVAMRPAQRQIFEALPPDPMRDAQLAMLDDDFLPWQVAGSVVQLGASGLLIAAGVGLILRRGWGRTLGLAGGALALVWAALNVAVSLQTFDAVIESMPPDPNVPPGAVKLGMTIGAVAVGGCMGGIPLVCMILLLTPAVSAEIKAWDAWRHAEEAF